MDFPTVYKIMKEGYSIVGNDGTEVDYADGGKMRKRILYPVTQYEINFKILVKTPQEALNVRQFYNSYKYETIQWTDPWTGEIYDVSMVEEPRVVRTEKNYGFMDVKLQGVVHFD